MALLGSGRKLRSLDAICAKLKQEAESTPDSNQEENSQDVPKTNEVETNGEKNEDTEETESLERDVNETKKNLNETGIKSDVSKVKKAAKENIENGIKNDQKAHENFNNKETEGCEKEESSNTETNESKMLEHSQNVDSTPVEYSCRKGRRKAATPRSITQVQKLYNQFDIDEKDELAEYEINNLNTNFPPDDEDLYDSEEKQSSPSSSIQGSSVSFDEYTKEIQDANNSSDTLKHSKEKSSNHSKELSSSTSVTHSKLASSPLDLSISNGYVANEDDDNSTSIDLSVRSSNDVRKDSSNSEDKMSSPADSKSESGDHADFKSESGDHAANLKDYAENTMNELLSMYGLGGAGEGGVGEIESLAGQVPLKNFTQMLQKVHNQMGSLGTKIPLKIPLQGLVDERKSGNTTGSSSLGKQQKGIYANYVQNSTTVGVFKAEVIQSGDKFINCSGNTGLFSKPSLVTKGPVLSPAATSPVSLQIQGGKFPLPDYTKYLKRYVSGKECGGSHCQDLGYKEHYHCLDCSFQVFVKKEEMVRHFKWHKKRDESLQHGFMRYSPLDSCVEKFGPCTHNGRQTHYHCLQPGCDKVYISTSDVQMHANYHRKDSAIIQEGFQRFRATEDCGTPSCTFYGQRTTHFHCRRSNCYFTFKNKADMEKHKTYHQKDEILAKDGFKKFMKYEHCAHNSCRYSKVSNHIHCIRTGCDYVLHSTAQLYSHKRKHERKDFENAYKRYREEHTKPQIRPAPTNNSSQIQEPGTPLQNHKTQMVLQAVPMLPNVIGGLLTTGAFKRSGSPVNEPFELKRIKVEPEDNISMSSSPVPEDFSSSAAGEMSNVVSPSGTDFSDSNLEDEMSDNSQMSSLADNSSEISREKLNDSLNLPIPLIGKKEVKREESPSPTSSMPNTLNIPLTQSLTNTPLISPEATVLQPPRTVYTERREKDDSWKNYLVRYTANDPCNPRCQYLYKDHYHCKIEGCLVLFKSKDGVREHARFHELQDRITPIAYRYYDQENLCPENCQYSLKEKHYHCIWSGCTHVVPHIGPTFGRLEHYRVHEYNRAAAGKTYTRPALRVDDNGIRRRGRPPKYPRNEIPKIPKVSLSEEEIHHLTQASCNGENMSDKKVVNGFRMFTKDDPCPDDQCVYLGMVHYHCARPRCYTSTDRLDVLNLHAKDFHSFVKILDGFEFFDRNVSCRRPHCQNNKTNRHFHCIRPKCDYSFVRHSTMAQHDKKHTATGLKIAPIPAIKTESDSSNFVPIVPATTSSVASLVKTSGTYFPINTFSPIQNIAQGSITVPVASSIVNASSSSGNPTTIQTSLTISPMQALTATPSNTQFVTAITSITAPLVTTLPVAISSGNTTVPLTVLLQQKTENHIPQPSWSFLKNKMHYAIDQNCGRPFCKLKKKDHFHCLECNQAFSDPARLRSHIGKHGIKLKRSEVGTRVVKPNIPVTIAPRPPPPVTMVTTQNVVTNAAILHKLPKVNSRSGEGCLEEEEAQNEEGEDGGEINPSSSLTLNPSTFSNLIAKAQEENRINATENVDDYGDEEQQDSDSGYQPNGEIEDEDSRESFDAEFSTKEDFSRHSGRKRIATKHNDFVDSNSINIKQRRVSSPRAKDDSVPEGYSRFRYNEDCQHFKCTYRQNVTHFHCMRSDCGYGFSDRSRLVQHTLRHERIDSITGGEMQQYRINQDCSSDCEFKNKMSHFHCLRCSYICTDSSKVLTHRKQHAKWDSINNQGFRKYSTTDNCGVLMCIFKRKQTHYHCTSTDCQYAVLSPAQMAPHKMKHVTMNS